ncbi:MAG: hypothetical protein LBG58_01400 [Planctomycetaceae bacterium]|nr:hypothetical protein [Planctomycetaceae bacterium]
MRLQKTYLFASFIGSSVCTLILFCIALQQYVIGECNNNIVVEDFCLPESAWVWCSGATDSASCTGRESKSSVGMFQPLGTQYSHGSNKHTTGPIIQNRNCYTKRTCEWVENDLYNDDGCYQITGSAVSVPDNMPIYTETQCPG